MSSENPVKPLSYSMFTFSLFFSSLQLQVNMVKITERVVNTYFARLFFSKVKSYVLVFMEK